MIGTLFNSAAIMLGSLSGSFLSKKTKIAQNSSFIQIMGGFVLLIGMQSTKVANSGTRFIVMMLAVILGGVLGEMLRIDQRIENFSKTIESYFIKSTNSTFLHEEKGILRAFIASSLLFCIGPMAILGSLQEALKHDPSLLFSKAILDGAISLAMSVTLGIGILFSAISVLIYQGSLTLLAEQAQIILTPTVIDGISCVGGVMLLFTGLNLIGVTRIVVVNLLPGILLGGLFAHYFW